MRIGELLVARGHVSAEQLEEALANQVLLGGRLGTNLVELGHLELDHLAATLGEQLGMPAALGQHFEEADQALVERLSPDLAARWCAIPLHRIASEPPTVAIAVLEPLAEQGVAELREALGAELHCAIAAELRIFYYLERCYGLVRSNRFLRVRPAEEWVDIDTSEYDEDPPTGEFQRNQTIPGTDRPERRRYVSTLSDLPIDADEPLQLGRIAIRRIELPTPAEPPTRAALSLEEVVRAVRAATGRDRVGDLVLSAFEFGFDERFDVAALWVIRGPAAVGWKGFVRGGDRGVFENLALPLSAPSILLEPYLHEEPWFGPAHKGGSELDRRLWAVLGVPAPAEVCVLPIVVAGHLVCLMSAQTRQPISDTDRADVQRLGDSVRTAFERLIRAAQR